MPASYYSCKLIGRWLCNSFFFNDTATTEIYTLSLHDALPILICFLCAVHSFILAVPVKKRRDLLARSEEHTSELQSRPHLVCRLLLEKKKKLFSPSGDNSLGRHLRNILLSVFFF